MATSETSQPEKNITVINVTAGGNQDDNSNKHTSEHKSELKGKADVLKGEKVEPSKQKEILATGENKITKNPKGNSEEATDQTLREENDRLKEQLKKLESEIDTFRTRNTELEEQTKALKEENEKLREKEKDNLTNDLKPNSREVTLKDQVKKLEADNSRLESDIDRLRTSLSKFAGKQMTEGNPSIADLSDPYRPQKLAERFSSVYDNQWTDAYDIVNKKCKVEKNVCEELMHIFKSCWEFCLQVFDKKQLEIRYSNLTVPDIVNKNNQNKHGDDVPKCTSKAFKDSMKPFAQNFIPVLCRKYCEKSKGTDELLRPYIDACVELCWYSLLNDPSVDFEFSAKKLDDFRGYTQTGEKIDFIVWPAMYLHKNGPLLYKGVVQFKSDKK